MTEEWPTLVNGRPAATSLAGDRGLMYGDGVFRTMRMRAGRVDAWSGHYRKLALDAARLRIPCPGREVWEDDIRTLAAAAPDCVVKLVLTRGQGGRGYAPPVGSEPTRISLASPLPDYPAQFRSEGVVVHVCGIRLAHQPCLAGAKHLNRLENVLARMEWSDPEIAEGLMLDAGGHVIEGTMSNLFMRRGRELMTPDLSACGVAGLQRERILGLAPTMGWVPRVQSITLTDLYAADEVFLTNSVIGVWPVKQIGTQAVATGPVARQFQECLDAAAD